MAIQLAPRRQHEECAGQQDQEEADADHDAERPEQGQYARNGVIGRLRDLRISCLTRIIDIALQKQRITHPLAIIGEYILDVLRHNACIACSTDFLKRIISDDTLTDMALRIFDELLNAFDWCCQRACTNQTHDPRNMHGIMGFTCFLIWKAEDSE